MIPHDTINTILNTANVYDVFKEFETLNKSGKDYITTCPACGVFDKNNKKGITISKAKNMAKCFICDKSYSPVDYLTQVQHMEYPEAIKWLGKLYAIDVTEVAPPRGPQKNKPGQASFLERQLKESGLTIDDIKVTEKVDDKTTKQVKCFEAGTIDQFGRIVPGDDIIIWYYDLHGNRMTYQAPKKTKYEELWRVRWQFPEQHLDKDGNSYKYKSPAGSGVHIFIPQPVREAFQCKRVINRLYIQEGEKKAIKACKHGLLSIGLMGIHGLASKGSLPHELQQILTACSVKEIVFVLDSDWDELSKDLKSEQKVDKRTWSFYNAIKNYKDYLNSYTREGIYIETFFAHIKPDHGQKGIDDLLTVTLKEKEINLLRDFDNAIAGIKTDDGNGEYVKCYKITGMADSKLMEIFCLQSSEAFAKKHEQQLRNLSCFRIGKYIWKFNEDENKDSLLDLAQPLTDDQLYYRRQVRFDKKGNEYVVYNFDHLALFNFLKAHGYGRLMTADVMSKNFNFIKIDRKIVESVHSWQIRDYVINITKETAPKVHLNDIMNMLFRGQRLYFCNDMLASMDFVYPEFNFASPQFQYMFFRDKYWKITANGIEEKPLNEVDTHIWADKVNNINPSIIKNFIKVEKIEQTPEWESILKRCFENNGQKRPDASDLEALYGKFDISFSEESEKHSFVKFLQLTSNFTWKKEFDVKRKPIPGNTITVEEIIENKLHIMSKLTALGYLCHNYFDPTASKSIIAIDGSDSAVGESNGGTGKSLFADAVAKIAITVKINGKNRNLTDDQFWAEEVTEKTEVICVDDCRNNLDFEFFFPGITGNFIVNRKGQIKFTLPKRETPKFLFTTNGAINGEGSSFRRRQSYIVFSDYFDDTHTPLDEFGLRMFDEWDLDQWNYFFNVAAVAVHLYLKYGLVEPSKEKIRNRTLRQFIGEEYLQWADDYFGREEETFGIMQKVNLNKQIPRHDLFTSWQDQNKHQIKYITPHKWKKKLIAWCQYRGFYFNKINDGKDIKQGGVELIEISEHAML